MSGRTHPSTVYAESYGERPNTLAWASPGEVWDDEFDGSELLKAMIRRRDERLAATGEFDEDTSALIVLLRQIDKRYRALDDEAEPTLQACRDRLAIIGPPEPDEWDTDDDYAETIRRRDYWRDAG